jgi:hypothetical protein
MSQDTFDEAQAKEAAGAFLGFMDSLGPNDIYKRVFLEVLLEEIYGQQVDLSDVFKIELTKKKS